MIIGRGWKRMIIMSRSGRSIHRGFAHESAGWAGVWNCMLYNAYDAEHSWDTSHTDRFKSIFSPIYQVQ